MPVGESEKKYLAVICLQSCVPMIHNRNYHTEWKRNPAAGRKGEVHMKYFGEGLSGKHRELGSIIRKATELERSKALFLEIHAKLHPSSVSGTEKNEVDILLCDLKREEYAIMPTVKDETIAWGLWHTARIEDLTMNRLVARREQVFDKSWKDRIHVSITDTGNALSDDEIMRLSRDIDIDELICYRSQVAARTRDVVRGLCAEDMRRKVLPADLDKIRFEGGVTRQEDSAWLLEYWEKKDVAGLLLLPPTRHVMLHLNDCCKWKAFARTSKKPPFRQ